MTYRTLFLPNAIGVKPAEVDMHDHAIGWYDQLTAGFSEIRSHFSDILAARNYGTTFALSALAIVIAVLFVHREPQARAEGKRACEPTGYP
jgi:hypothetical protein